MIVLHDFEHLHPFVFELDDMVVAEMGRLGLSQFIDMPSIESHQVTYGTPKRRRHLVTPDSAESCNDEDDPRPMRVCMRSLLNHGWWTRVSRMCSGQTLRARQGVARPLLGWAGSITGGEDPWIMNSFSNSLQRAGLLV